MLWGYSLAFTWPPVERRDFLQLGLEQLHPRLLQLAGLLLAAKHSGHFNQLRVIRQRVLAGRCQRPKPLVCRQQRLDAVVAVKSPTQDTQGLQPNFDSGSPASGSSPPTPAVEH